MVGKNRTLIFSFYLIGMFSVSIANLFGGYYWSVVAVSAVLVTTLILDVLDKNMFESYKMDFLFGAVLIMFEFLFFVVNDIIGHPVYDSKQIDFFGGCVIATQAYSSLMVVYYLIKTVLEFVRKDTIELVEENESDALNGKNDSESFCEGTIDDNMNGTSVEEVKRIPRVDIKKNVPFMEEEK